MQDARFTNSPFLMFVLVIIVLLFMSEYAFACTISTTAVDFGNYTSNQASYLDGTGSVTVNCVSGAYEIGLNGGQTSDINNRKMNSGSNYLYYQLYKDSDRAIIWGNTEGSNTLSDTGNGSDQPHTVYGRIPANQNVSPGAYSDTVTATVTW